MRYAICYILATFLGLIGGILGLIMQTIKVIMIGTLMMVGVIFTFFYLPFKVAFAIAFSGKNKQRGEGHGISAGW